MKCCLSEEELENKIRKSKRRVFIRGINRRELRQLDEDGPEKFIFHYGTYYTDNFSSLSTQSFFHGTGVVIARIETLRDIRKDRFRGVHSEIKYDFSKNRLLVAENYYTCHQTFTGTVYVCKYR